ncbi:uncharacterized protein PODANS_6_784 [Podospora anserina S mat+]|uniref:Podospora anserina S mat+ genomic DNA chromosome 6, supercontig 2 n=1 Tax=Podospora anserina (strain S / ATCC MYA-4624 / DSM 980 / FGSC 10383) TaxID=515849 RepID=B2B380_PODAN|nr:uncharacterized protein PODANS_6_784 [Podospora anserina S mat+]CAP71566.1 unnamed protein product [Podospora anserina S mat+]CDP30962.1 Putative protein of unknown function [Podospora anserina S mat+]
MKPQEKRLLQYELSRWEKKMKAKGQAVDNSLVVQIALLSFLRWSWASDTLRAVFKYLIAMLSQPSISQDRHMEILGRSLGCRDDGGLMPYDVRQDRTKDFMVDPDNQSFWDVMRRTPEVLRNAVREMGCLVSYSNFVLHPDSTVLMKSELVTGAPSLG